MKFLLLLALIIGSAQSITAEDKKPNFVIFFLDDLGYGDVGCFGNKVIKTPRIDKLAAEGLIFDNFYAQNVCGPSRSALLTGCYPLRNAKKHNRVTVHPFLHLEEITIAEVLKPQGYVSACIGKWDQAGHSVRGFDPSLMPTKQGFDYYFGTPSSNDRELHWVENGKTVEKRPKMETCTPTLTDKTIAFIERNKEKPFFVYLAHPMPHVKLAATEKFRGKSKGGLYGDVVEELDYNIGRVIDCLKEHKLAENTYVIFTSDNGPWYMEKSKTHQKRGETDHGGVSTPLRGHKVSVWEGGSRVPCIVWRPGTVPAGQKNSEIVRTLDFLPTLANLAGAKTPQDRIIDGKDVTDLFHGVKGAKSPSNTFFYYNATQLCAVRKGDWKLHLGLKKNVQELWNKYLKDSDIVDTSKPRLYNLIKDIGETKDLASEYPEIVQELQALAETAREDIGDYNRKGKGARFFDPQPQRPDIK